MAVAKRKSEKKFRLVTGVEPERIVRMAMKKEYDYFLLDLWGEESF